MSQNPLNIWREMLEHTIIQYILNNWPTEYWILNNYSIQFNSIHSVGPGPTEYWIILLNNYSVFSWSIIQYSVDYSVFSWSRAVKRVSMVWAQELLVRSLGHRSLATPWLRSFWSGCNFDQESYIFLCAGAREQRRLCAVRLSYCVLQLHIIVLFQSTMWRIVFVHATRTRK